VVEAILDGLQLFRAASNVVKLYLWRRYCHFGGFALLLSPPTSLHAMNPTHGSTTAKKPL
jgi:hypothetical protein